MTQRIVTTQSAAAPQRRRGYAVVFGLWLLLALYSVSLPVAVHASRSTLVTLVSGSMAPTYPAGSVLLLKKVDAAHAIRVNDVITVTRGNGLPVTHRVVQVVSLPTSTAYRTQGDANASADAELALPGSVMGRIQGRLPTVLEGALWLHGRWQRLLLFGLPLVVIAMGEWRVLRRHALRPESP